MAIAHGSFTLTRSYAHSPERVFRAFADKAVKRRWFVEGEGWIVHAYEMDFRVGGREASRFQFGDGPQVINEGVYHDIVENRRIVLSYRMAMANAPPFSVSLVTIEFAPEAGGARLTHTEQGAYYNGPDDIKGREEGSRELLDALEKELAAHA